MQGQSLSGQGLCARALYDYQAGKIRLADRHRSQILRLGNKNVDRDFLGVSSRGYLKEKIRDGRPSGVGMPVALERLS